MAYSDDELQALYGNAPMSLQDGPTTPTALDTTPDVPFKLGRQVANIVPGAINSLAGDVNKIASYVDPQALTSDYLAGAKNPLPAFNVGPNTGLKDTFLNDVAPEVASWMVPYEGALKGAKALGGVAKFSELPIAARIAAEAVAQGGANAITSAPSDNSLQQGAMGAASGVLQQALPRWQRALPLAAISYLGSGGDLTQTIANTVGNLLPGHSVTIPKAPADFSAVHDAMGSLAPTGPIENPWAGKDQSFSFMNDEVPFGGHPGVNDIPNAPIPQFQDVTAAQLNTPQLDRSPVQMDLPLQQTTNPTGLRVNYDTPELPQLDTTPNVSTDDLRLVGAKSPVAEQSMFPLIDLQSESRFNPDQPNFQLVEQPPVEGPQLKDGVWSNTSTKMENLPLFDWRNEQTNRLPDHPLLEDRAPIEGEPSASAPTPEAPPEPSPSVAPEAPTEKNKVDRYYTTAEGKGRGMADAIRSVEIDPSGKEVQGEHFEQFTTNRDAKARLEELNGKLKNEPVVTRAQDFKDSGNYDVKLPNGDTHQMFRDPESKTWYRLEAPGEPQSHYTDRFIGFTKDEALASLAKRKPQSFKTENVSDKLNTEPPKVLETASELHAAADASGSVYQPPKAGTKATGDLHAFKELSTNGNFSIKASEATPQRIAEKAEAVRQSFAGQTPVTEDNLLDFLKQLGVEVPEESKAPHAESLPPKGLDQDPQDLARAKKLSDLQDKLREAQQDVKDGDEEAKITVRALQTAIDKHLNPAKFKQLSSEFHNRLKEGGFMNLPVDAQVAIAAAGIVGLVAYQKTKGDIGTSLAAALVVAGLGIGGVKALEALRGRVGPEIKGLVVPKEGLKTVAEKFKQLAIDTTRTPAGLAVGGRAGVWPTANKLIEGLTGLNQIEAFKNAKTKAAGFVADQVEQLRNALEATKSSRPSPGFQEAEARFLRGQLADTKVIQDTLNNGGSILSGPTGMWDSLPSNQKALYPEKWMVLDDPKSTNTKGDGVEIWHVTNNTKQQLMQLQRDALNRAATTSDDKVYASFPLKYREVADNLMSMYHDALPEGAAKNRLTGTAGQYITRSHAIITDPKMYPSEPEIQNAMSRLGVLKENDFLSSVGASDQPSATHTTGVNWRGTTMYLTPDDAAKFQFLHTPESLRGLVRDYIKEIKTTVAMKKGGAIPEDTEQFMGSLFTGRKELDEVTQALLGTHQAPFEMMQTTLNKIVPSAQVGAFMKDAVQMVDPKSGLKIALNESDYNKAVTAFRDVMNNPVSSPADKRLATNKYQELISYSKAPNEPRFSLAQDMYISRQLKDKMAGFDGSPFGMLDNSIGRGLHNFNSFFKTTHLSLSPATIARQFVQAPLMMMMGGVRDINMIKSGFDGYMDRSAGFGKWMNENGVFSASARHGDFNQSLTDVLSGETDKTIWDSIKRGVNKAHTFFSLPDDVVRASVFMNEAKRAAQELGVPLESMDQRVADRALQFTLRRAMDFGNLPRAVKLGREVPFVNLFLGYTYEIARITKNMAVDASKGDLQAGATLAGMATLPFLAQQQAEQALSPQDRLAWTKAQNVAQDYSRPRFKIPVGRNADGSFTYYDITSILPFNDYQMMARSVLNGDAESFAAVNPLIGFDKSPFFSVAVPQITGKDQHTQRDFRDNTDRLKNFAQQLLPAVTPGIGYEYQKSAPEALGGQLGVTNLKTGRTNSPIGTLLRNFTGIDQTTVNPDIATKQFVVAAQQQIANEKAYLMDTLKSSQNDATKQRAIQRFQEAAQTIAQEMQSKIQINP